MSDLGISLRLKDVYDIKKKMSGLTRYVNEYVFGRMSGPLTRIEKRLIDYVYTRGPQKRSGTLGHAVVTYKKKINQYSSDYGWMIDTSVAPYAEVHIGSPNMITLRAKNAERMRWRSTVTGGWVAKREIEITHRADPDMMNNYFRSDVSFDISRLSGAAIKRFVRENK